MNKLEEGMWVRTKGGFIDKIVSFKSTVVNDYVELEDKYYANKKDIQKSSYNIIDLIEEGDYVNGLPVESVEGTWEDKKDLRVWLGVATYGKQSKLPYHKYVVKDEFNNDYDLSFRCIKPEDIKSIVTKEQFETIKYMVGNSNE